MRIIRSITVPLLAAVCAVAVGCAQQTSDVQQKHESTEQDHPDTQDHGKITLAALQDDMRALWTDHVAYTRFYIIEAIADLPEAPFTATRLLENQDAIGDAIKPFYGDAAGDELSRLLRVHITGAVDVLVAAKAGDRDALTAASDAWYANADDISHFLADANPNWPFDTIRDAMHMHLDQTIAEATARLTGDWEGDVRAFDEIVDHILFMADTLTLGIALQFPDKVTGDPASPAHLAMRKLWEDHVFWTRNVILSALAANDCADPLPDLDAALTRLLQNQEDIGNAARPFVGDAGADQLTTLLKEHITVAGDILFAAKAGDTDALNAAVATWYDNADEIAQLLSDALGLPLADVEDMMKTHLDQTLNEARHHLTGKFEQDIHDYDQVVKHILMMADGISDAL